MRIALSLGLVALAAVWCVLAWRAYRQLEAWYREDAGRLWERQPWRVTMPVLGLGVAIFVAAFVGALNGLIEPWSFFVCVPVGAGLRVLTIPAMSPARHALREVRRDPMKYPVPETARRDQGRVALAIVGGMVVIIGAVVGFIVWFASSAFP